MIKEIQMNEPINETPPAPATEIAVGDLTGSNAILIDSSTPTDAPILNVTTDGQIADAAPNLDRQPDASVDVAINAAENALDAMEIAPITTADDAGNAEESSERAELIASGHVTLESDGSITGELPQSGPDGAIATPTPAVTIAIPVGKPEGGYSPLRMDVRLTPQQAETLDAIAVGLRGIGVTVTSRQAAINWLLDQVGQGR
jgi:hypothetical protein